MLSERKHTILSDVAYITMGQSPKGEDCNNFAQGVPLLNGPTEFDSWHPIATQFTTDPKQLARMGDLLFCVRGSTTGRMNWADQPYAIGRGIAAIRHKLGPDAQAYLRAVIELNLPMLLQSATGSTFPNVGKPLLGSLKVKNASDEDVLKISNVINGFDSKISLNYDINQILENMAQTLFNSWFIDFIPVIDNALDAGNPIPSPLQEKARFRQKVRTRADFTPMPDDIRQLFPSKFEKSDSQWIPKGWEVKALDEIANFQNGLALQKFRPEGDDFLPVLKIAQLKKGVADNEEKASPTIKPAYIIENGDVVFSWSGSLLVDVWCGGRVALNQHLFKVTSKIYQKWLYYYYTKQHLTEFQRIAAAKAVTMGHIKREHLSMAMCTIPPALLLEKGDEVIGTLLENQIKQRNENNQLVSVREGLLSKLVSGEIKIPD